MGNSLIKFKVIRNQNGFSVTEALIGIALISIVSFGFMDVWSQSSTATAYVSKMSAANGFDSSIRALFKNPTSCQCNFNGLNLSASIASIATPTDIPGIKFYADNTCSTAKEMATPGQMMGNPSDGMQVTSTKLVRVRKLPDNMAVADLEVQYTGGSTSQPIVISNLMLKTDGSNVVTDCVDSGAVGGAASSPPFVCGDGKLCIGGKSVEFTNDSGSAVSVSVNSVNAPNNVDAFFVTPTGRRMLMNLQIVNGELVATAPLGWRGQFCYSHPTAVPRCAVSSDYTFGVRQYNCGSALYWRGDFNGNTLSSTYVCPANQPAISAPNTNCSGEWSPCSVSCGPGGTRTYSIYTPAGINGLACPFAHGAVQTCAGQPCSTDGAYPDETTYTPPEDVVCGQGQEPDGNGGCRTVQAQCGQGQEPDGSGGCRTAQAQCGQGQEPDGNGGCRTVQAQCGQGQEPDGNGGCRTVQAQCGQGQEPDGSGGCRTVQAQCGSGLFPDGFGGCKGQDFCHSQEEPDGSGGCRSTCGGYNQQICN